MKCINLIFLYFIFISYCVYCQSPKDKYNFDFEFPLKGSAWLCILDNFRAGVDSLNKVNGRRSLLLSRSFLKTEFNLCLSQTILLPESVKKVKATIYAENDQLLSAELKIIGLDKNRNLIACDSISLISNERWQKFATEIITNQRIDILVVEIKAKETFNEPKKKVKLWVDNLHLMLNGIDLYEYKDSNYQFSKAECSDIMNNILLTPLLEIPAKEIKSIKARIIGFGESVHGSNEISQSVFKNIRQLITNQGCHLVLLEIPIDLGIRLNQYIQEENFDEELKSLISGYHIDYTELYSFIEWLKKYNITANEKVSIFGFDNYSGYSPRHINNFILSKKSNLPAIDTLLRMINSWNYRSIPLKFAEKHADQFLPVFGEKAYSTLIQCLKIRTDSLCRKMPLFQSSDWHAINRDYLLWQNTKFAIDNLSDRKSKIAIFSHLSHLNKKVPIFLNSVKSLGQYTTEYYGDNYYLIGMLIGEGTISTFISPNKMISQKIEFPAQRSIENICLLAKVNYFYKTLPLLSTVPVLYRSIGGFYSPNMQYNPSFTNGSMDAIVFIRQSTGAKIFPTIQMQGYEVYDLYKKSKSLWSTDQSTER